MTLTPHYLRKFRNWVDFLADRFPHDSTTDTVVQLSSKIGMGTGDCFRRENGVYRIRIGNRPPSDRMVYTAAVNTLMHEWAHPLAYDSEPDHSDLWGLAYAAIYRECESIDAGITGAED